MFLATLLALAAPQCSETSMPPHLPGSDRIGTAVALDGDTALITETNHGGPFIWPDFVVVHERIGGVWTPTSSLPRPANFGTYDRFGSHVALSGDTAAVLHDRSVNRTEVVIYRRVMGAWQIEETLLPLPGHLLDGLALDGDRLAVGSRTAAGLVGVVFVYERSGSSWTLDQAVSPATVPAVSFLGFGQSIDLDGDRMAVGTFPLGAAFQSGSAYVMERTPSGWAEAAFLVAPTQSVGDRFGMDVAIDGDWVLVGAENASTFSFQAGTVHAFAHGTSGWGHRQTLANEAIFPALGGLGDAKLGAQVDLSGDVAVASMTRVNGAVRGGGVQVWQLDQGVWVSRGAVRPIDPAPRDRFGGAVALDGDRLLTSRQEWILPSRAFVFEGVTHCTYPQQLGTSICGPAVPNSSGLPAHTTISGHPAASAGVITLRTSDLPPFTAGYYLTSMTQGLSMPPGSQGLLCLGGSIGRFSEIVLGGGIAGQFQLTVDLRNLPTTPTQPALSGQTWLFQAWFRDANPNSTSNFSDAVGVTFL